VSDACSGGVLGSVLVTGAEGSIARALLHALATEGNTLWSTTRHRGSVAPQRLLLDLSEPPDQWRLPPVPVDVAFLCAAVASQEQCGSNPTATRLVNVLNTVELARRLVTAGAFVVFISTNLVFSGETPHIEADRPHHPQSAYGRQKAEAERRLLELGNQVSVVRFGKVIAPGMPLLERWVSDLRAGRSIHPFQDMVMAPIALGFAVNVLCRVASARRPGVIQATAARDMTYARAAEVIAERVGANPDLIEPVFRLQTGQIGGPNHGTLDCTELATLGLAAPSPESAFAFFGGTRHH
jgi:dTDP-4-dehydrorhamnose reductase